MEYKIVLKNGTEIGYVTLIENWCEDEKFLYCQKLNDNFVVINKDEISIINAIKYS